MTGRADTLPETAAVLARSDRRQAILRALADDALDLRDLRDELDVPRTTVQENLSVLQSRDLVTETSDRAYELTPLGRVALDALTEYTTTIRVMQDLRALLEHVPLDDFDLALTELDDADVVTPAAAHPLAPYRRFDELAAGASTLRLLTPVVTPVVSSSLADRVERGALDVDCVLDGAAASTLRAEYPDVRDALRRADDATLTTCPDRSLPFALALVDDVAGIFAFDDSGLPRALVLSDAARVRSWVADRFASVREPVPAETA